MKLIFRTGKLAVSRLNSSRDSGFSSRIWTIPPIIWDSWTLCKGSREVRGHAPPEKIRNLRSLSCWKCIQIVNPNTTTSFLYHFKSFRIPSGGPFLLLGGGGRGAYAPPCQQAWLLIITDNQFGFRSKHSTSHALILLTEKIRKSIDQGLFTCGIFLDLCKAFDTVDHSILLDKLSSYGIRGKAHDWFSSYLSNRRQFVSIGSSNSDPLPVRCGIPQGSVLGPLLFLICVNDLQKCSCLLEFHLFADDTNLFPNIANIHDSRIKHKL